ncbi:hypothetical protein [Nocardia amikacinitolerans]|uniref:hypothetical protein n=1 Tax=Nocardia amikacinitolerans TaxID=756689 RepID=UPI0020A553C0|nr:hypothetical protein [Nocardia amikacinitolerans]
MTPTVDNFDHSPFGDSVLCSVKRSVPGQAEGEMFADLVLAHDSDPNVAITPPEGFQSVPGVAESAWYRAGALETRFKATVNGWHGSLRVERDRSYNPNGFVEVSADFINLCAEFLVNLIRDMGAWK